MMRVRVGWRAVGCLAVCVVLEGTAAARSPEGQGADSLEACLDSYEQAQRLRKSGELIEAREALMVCSRDVCPEIAKADCTRWLAELRQDIPSVVLAAQYEDGRDAISVRVFLDGKPWVEQLDGAPLELNPGVYSLRFETPGYEPVEQRVSVRVGERNRKVAATFRPPEPVAPPPAPESGGVPTLSYVLGGVGVLGLAGFGYFAASGLSEESDLDACKPTCPADDVDSVRTRYLFADVSLAVGIVALGGASYFYFTRPSGSPDQDRGAVGVRLQTSPDQLGASIAGQF